jgi:hypothetical protein
MALHSRRLLVYQLAKDSGVAGVVMNDADLLVYQVGCKAVRVKPAEPDDEVTAAMHNTYSMKSKFF